MTHFAGYELPHDPLCPGCVASDGLCDSNCAACLCELIAQVRQDERTAIAYQINFLPWSHENWMAVDERAAILAAIKGGQP